MSRLDDVKILAFDVFGTVVDWYRGITEQVAAVAADAGSDLDAGAFALSWRGRYAPSLLSVLSGERAWANLDVLHRESLDALLAELGVADRFDDRARGRLVDAWHRLPAWPDSVAGLERLRGRFVTTTLSNGGFALLTDLVKRAALPFDAIVSTELFLTYKPDRRAYVCTAELFGVEPAEVMLVAAHRLDIEAAAGAGLHTAFVERPAEHGPDQPADTAAGLACGVAVRSFPELADVLGC